MNKLFVGALALTLLAGSAAAVSAQPYGGGQDHRDQADNGRHEGWSADQGGNHQWKRGQRMGYNDWNGAHPVDYRQHHLRQPPRGYEWRESNGQYVLGALAGGLIASTIINSGR